LQKAGGNRGVLNRHKQQPGREQNVARPKLSKLKEKEGGGPNNSQVSKTSDLRKNALAKTVPFWVITVVVIGMA